MLHDNARRHTAAQTALTINNPGWKLLSHPLYSPYLAPSDFHLCGPLKEFMRDTKFESDNEVRSVVSNWLRHQSKDFYAPGVRKLAHSLGKMRKIVGRLCLKKNIKLPSELYVLILKNSSYLLNDPRITIIVQMPRLYNKFFTTFHKKLTFFKKISTL